MKPGWYKNSKLKLTIENAKVWATQMGYTGEQHRDQTARIVTESLRDE